jgi:hypothetical protein
MKVVSALPLHCGNCSHAWEVAIQLPLELARAVRLLDGFVAQGCPNCDASGDAILTLGPPKGRRRPRKPLRKTPVSRGTQPDAVRG